MAVQKIKSGRIQANADEYVGNVGTLFFGEDAGDLRLSDGSTPGGISLSFGGGGGGNYVLPTASATVKGGVKVGTGLTITNSVLSASFSGSYNDLTSKPTIPTNLSDLTNDSGFITSSALSGYALTSSIPTNTNQLTNGAGFITTSALSGYATQVYVTSQGYITTAALTNYALKTEIPTVPTKVSDLTNDAGYVTSQDVQSIVDQAISTALSQVLRVE